MPLFAVIATVLVNVISLILACALNSKIKFKNTIKAFYFLPYMLGSLIVGFIFNYIFANLIPQLGKSFGIQALSVNILGTNHAIWGIIAVAVWTGCAFNTLIYIAGLQSIPGDIIEAAEIDGANKIQTLFKVTIPMMMPSITICMFLSITNGFKLFDQNLSLTAGEPSKMSEMMALNIFNTFYGRTGWEGVGQAKAVIFFAIVVVIGMIQLRATRSKEVQQ